ncbi:MAG: hypothetical protein ABIH89_06040 [Elusimicrobiota bacterium]
MLTASLTAEQQIIEVIDTPTATSKELGSYTIAIRLYDEGSLLTRLYYGIIVTNLTLGLSFDAENVVGSGEVKPRRPFLYIKIPLYPGSRKWPAISIGFDEQGLGDYNEDDEEYMIPPTGFFMVFTKTSFMTGLNFSLGANANYNFQKDAEKKLKGFCNADFMLGPEFMLLAEVKEITTWDSYFNFGAKYMVNHQLDFEFSVLDIGERIATERIIRINYSGEF